MKNNLKIAGLTLMLITFSLATKAQNSSKSNQTIASDAPSGYTYDFDKVMNLITSRIEAPKKENADAQVFLNSTDFPALPKSKLIDATYKEQIKIWMEKNPTLIINTLKSRKDIVTQF